MDVVVKSPQKSSGPIKKVIVHPLVLLSIVDHYNRISNNTRVVGVLLGRSFKGTVDVSNSYAAPFEENIMDPRDWFLNQDYVDTMLLKFKKLNAKENIVGWYSTGLNFRENDLEIHRVFQGYVRNPVLVIVDVRSVELGIPTKAFYDVAEVKETGTRKGQKVFVLAPSEIGAVETEEIGIEHLLRDVKHTTIKTLETEVSDKLTALKVLHAELRDKISWYSGIAVSELFPVKREILANLQDTLNYFPNLNDSELTKALTVKTKDMMCLIFLCSLIRCVIALHNLINNKIMNKELEKAGDAKEAKDAKPVEFHYGVPWNWYD